MNAMTKQDLFVVTEMAKNKIIERLVTKYDVQLACDSVRDKILGKLQEMQLDNQAAMRQVNAHSDQTWKKVAALEERIARLQSEVKSLQRLVSDRADEAEITQPPDFSPLPVK